MKNIILALVLVNTLIAGILFVSILAWAPNGGQTPNSPLADFSVVQKQEAIQSNHVARTMVQVIEPDQAKTMVRIIDKSKE